MDEGPESHGSTRIEKVPDNRAYRLGSGGRSLGKKVRRKVVSPLRCLTVTDMMTSAFG